MSVPTIFRGAVVLGALSSACAFVGAAKLVEVRTVDDENVMVHWLDGEVEHIDNGKGPTAFKGQPSGGEIVHRYDPGIDTTAAVATASYTLTSKDDPSYSQAVSPTTVFRKTKLNGADNTWPEAKYTLEHTVFLKLPQKLQQGKHYTLNMAPATHTDVPLRDFTFDIYSSVSEAIHVNIIGYNPDQPIKSADLYMWLGDGGGRDYSSYDGRKVTLYNVDSGAKSDGGTVTFWKKQGADVGGHNYTASDVWNCDFSSFNQTGKYRLVIDGIGCSPDFLVSRQAYFEPYKTSVRGFYYMRIGEPKPAAGLPVPRQPQYIPDKDPVGFKVYMTSYGPFHPDWAKKGGDQWDNRDWSMYKDAGNPTNPNAYGGHSDAGDWDRNLGHISIIWDMLLPYELSNGKLSDDDLEIRESGNGIPDIIDEARNEVDFWLRCRDSKGGYSCGVNNPDDGKKLMYQAGASPYMAWASAANAAMLADCFRIAGKTDLMNQYRDAALEAWKVANEEGLDLHWGIGNGQMRGRDLKMMAAAYLYNVTGDKMHEDVVAKESVAKSATAELDNEKRGNQYWGTAAYLLCAKNNLRPIHYPELVANMKAAIINEAKQKNAIPSTQRPSRRSSNTAYTYFQSTEEVQALTIAHAVATDAADKEMFLKAMILEADWGQGRNPLNATQMTGLGSRRPEHIFTIGHNDGVPGDVPGHTPYMNPDNWGNNKAGAHMSSPQWMAVKGFPEWKQWPWGEALWDAPFCYANNEFTPQQTMRGKMALLGYLYSLGDSHVAK